MSWNLAGHVALEAFTKAFTKSRPFEGFAWALLKGSWCEDLHTFSQHWLVRCTTHHMREDTTNRKEAVINWGWMYPLTHPPPFGLLKPWVWTCWDQGVGHVSDMCGATYCSCTQSIPAFSEWQEILHSVLRNNPLTDMSNTEGILVAIWRMWWRISSSLHQFLKSYWAQHH
jgi:hypothetical protein